MKTAALAPLAGARPFTTATACPETSPASRPRIQTPDRAFTRLECLVILATLALLATLATPLLGNTVFRTQRAVCANNLRQVATGFRAYAMNHQGKYPWFVNTNNSAGQNFRDVGFEFGTTKITVCPSDSQRSAAVSFTNFTPAVNLSYFLNLQAQEHQSANWLAGDRNISIYLAATNYTTYSWQTQANHEKEGNIALVDGRVLQLHSEELKPSVYLVLSNGYAIYLVKP